ncbi:hypothetical protein OESDEN_13186 [Oesophagostomum dentatum]|uniref:CHK kinase-like domain-containing protein n=1 Tax=Oesophagostomum dentatum TaxID=61180 RepID=A0A0B1ST26_OESDE|nr:hypothetical protein OESDEN_13186 [Oesophagostomum dentatum]
MRRVLCHGDLWSTNLLWRGDGDDLTLAAVIDFQQTHMGCAATDLVRLFGTCLSSQDRRDHSEKLLEEFYGYLKDEVDAMEMPYTLEQPIMHLYTPGEGLLGTHVTWKDIEEDMRRELHTSASFGPNKSASNIGDGKGFCSKILLIDPDWQNKDKDLPERFVVKILTQLPLPTAPGEIPAIPNDAAKMKEFMTETEDFLKLMLDMMMIEMRKIGDGQLAEKFGRVQKVVPELF